MEIILDWLKTLNWEAIGLVAAGMAFVIHNFMTGWQKGPRLPQHPPSQPTNPSPDLTPVQMCAGERTRMQALEENQQRTLSGLAALRSDMAAVDASLERIEDYLHKIGDDVSHNRRVGDWVEEKIICILKKTP